MPDFVLTGQVNLQDNFAEFENRVQKTSENYAHAVTKMNKENIKSPLADESTKEGVDKAYDYVFNNLSIDAFSAVRKEVASLPQGIQNAMNNLVSGITRSMDAIDHTFDTIGSKMKKSFDPIGFTNNLRFNTANINSYIKDIQKATTYANTMTDKTRTAVSENYKQLSSLVDPAITQLRTKHHEYLDDRSMIARMMSDDAEYEHIRKYLSHMGITTQRQQEQALGFAITTSANRRFRNDVAKQFVESKTGMQEIKLPVYVTDQVPERYRDSYLSGGNKIARGAGYVPPALKPNKKLDEETYANIKRDVLSGNHIAYLAAKNAGLIHEANGYYRFAERRYVNSKMLDQYGGYVAREGNYAAQGQPHHLRDITSLTDAGRILGNDSKGLNEAISAMNSDRRTDAQPYFDPHYVRPEGVRYEKGEQGRHMMPELRIPEMVNIPRMVVQNVGGKKQLVVKRRTDNGYEYSPNLDFSWQKTDGVEATVDDEWVTMGRNPILDRVLKLHPKAKFEDRTFMYGRDSEGHAKGGAPLIVNVPLSEYFEKDRYGQIRFEGEGMDRMPVLKKGAQELIDTLYRGGKNGQVNLTFDGQDISYTVVGGHTNEGGSLQLIQTKDYEKINAQDIKAGRIPLLSFFNEVDPVTGRLINPETGEAFKQNSEATKAFAKYFDARNKIFSHSIPVQEMGMKQPKAAIVNLDPFYNTHNVEKKDQFDGGAYFDPSLYSSDFQARMGPAKFLATRANWKKWFIDAGFAYKDQALEGDNKYHFYVPGQGTTDEQYKEYERLVGEYRKATGQTKTDLGEQIKALRKDNLVDIMDNSLGMIISNTALKSVSQLRRITPEMYNNVVKALSGRGKQTSFDQEIDIDSFRKSGKTMVDLNSTQANELFNIFANPKSGLGLRAMKDTENYAGSKGFWSPAYMSSVRMTASMMKKSNDNYAKAFANFSTEQGLLEQVFSGSDKLSKRVRQDPRLMFTDIAAQAEIQNAWNELQEKQLRGYAYFPGMSQMFLANPNLYSVFNGIGAALSGHDAQGEAAKLKVASGTVIANIGQDLKKRKPGETDTEYNNRIKALNNSLINFTRSPYAAGANFFGSAQYGEYLKRYGLTTNSAHINMSDMYSLNTGDFDGDFIWAYLADENEEEFKELTERRNAAVAEAQKNREKYEADKKALRKQQGVKDTVNENYDGTSFALAWLRDTASINSIGVGYKAGQVAYRTKKMSDAEAALVDDFANYIYGAGIDKKKNPDLEIYQARDVAKVVDEATKTRKPIERFVDDILSENENAKFGQTDIFNYALPTYFDPLGTAILQNARTGYNANAMYGESIRKAINDNINARYGKASKEELALAQWWGDLVGSKLTGEYQISSVKQLEEGQSLLRAVQNRAKQMANENPDSQELKDINGLIYRAQSAISTERTMGYYEGILDDINDHYDQMHWENPLKLLSGGFVTQVDEDAARALYRINRNKQEKAFQDEQKQRVTDIVSNLTGKASGAIDDNNVLERLHAAHMFTGFNWSNAKYFADNKLEFNRIAHWEGLDGSESQTQQGPLVLSFTDEEKAKHQKSIARRILTGEEPPSDLSADAFVGSAAHEYMDKYALARIDKKTHEEAADIAYKAFEDYIFGDKHKADRDRIRLSFTKNKDNMIEAISDMFDDETMARVNDKLMIASRRGPNPNQHNGGSTLDYVAKEFYDKQTLDPNGDYRIIMTEGSPVDAQGNLLKPRNANGNNGIYLKPMRDGKNVIDFQRYYKDDSGKIQHKDVGMYFTPDMIRQRKSDGKFEIVDWKSSPSGQMESLFQMSYYAHQLEQLGKEYYKSGGSRQDLEWFKQFWNNDKNESNINSISGISILNTNKNVRNGRRLRLNYTAELGEIAAKWLESGQINMAEAAKNGFFAQLPDYVKPVFKGRTLKGPRGVIAPEDEDNESQYFMNDFKKDKVYMDILMSNTVSEKGRQISNGGTGVSDGHGGYIDNDKSYIVAKFMKDQEKLDEIRQFANKQDKFLNNRSFGNIDEFTRNLNTLEGLFTKDQFETVQKYVNGGFVAPDAPLMLKDFNSVQKDAVQEMVRISELRNKYVENLDSTMRMDYDKILYGKGTGISKLRSAVMKQRADESAIKETYKSLYSPYYTGDRIDTSLSKYLVLSELTEEQKEERKRKPNESAKDYKKRIQELQANSQEYKDAKASVEKAKDVQTDLNKKLQTVSDESKLFQNSWIKEFEKTSTDERSIASMFKGQTLNEQITNMRDMAKTYELASTEQNSGFSAEVKEALAKQSLAFTKSADELEKQRGTKLESILAAPQAYNKARIDAMMTGGAISDKLLMDNAVNQFMGLYAQVNPDKGVEDVIKAGDKYREQLERDNINKLNNDIRSNQLVRQGAALRRNMHGGNSIVNRALSSLDSRISSFENYKLQTQSQIQEKEKWLTANQDKKGTDEYKNVENNVARLKQEASDADAALSQLQSPMGRINAITQQFGASMGRFARYYGRQYFMKMINEIKQFVKQFDASMTEIQAITLKSDEEMQGIRSQTINKALGLRTSVSNVANVEAALYRQGLSDADVSARTDSIIKFATVTKLNVQDATKIITTALQNDLVDSANAAMDALVALGDSAATTAAEIGKGMQKAAASAKVAGVSYAELTALLTIGTSDTQLSGTQVGTALQTVFTRMRRISTTGWAADQNGEKTSASDAEAALKAVGINLWDDKNLGKMRSAYDIMLDLSKVWQNLSDAQKSIVTGALAGTRQTNIFSTLMEGMSEDGGETLEKYLGLAEDSEGITQSKYEIAMQSLSASMDEFRSSWDALVESMISGGSVTGMLDGFSDLLQRIANVANNGGQAGVILGVIAGGIAAIGVAISGIATGPAGVLLQILAAVAGFRAVAGLTALFTGDNRTEAEKRKDNRDYELSHIAKLTENNKAQDAYYQKAITNVRKYGKEWEEVKDSSDIDSIVTAQENLRNSLKDLAVAFPDVSGQVLDSIKELANWEQVVDQAEKTAKKFSDQSKASESDRIEEYQSRYTEEEINDEALALGSPETMVKLRRGLYNYWGGQLGTANVGEVNDFDYTAAQNFANGHDQYVKVSALRNLRYYGDEDVQAFVQSFLKDTIAGGLLESIGETGLIDLSAADTQTMNAAYDRLTQYLFSDAANNPEYYKQVLRTIDQNKIRQLVSARTDFDNYIPENALYTGENYRSAVLSDLMKVIYDENGEIRSEYNKNGRVDFDRVLSELNTYKSKTTEEKQSIVDRSTSSDKIYSVGDNTFYNEKAANKFVKDNPDLYDTSDIKKSGTVINQRADKLIEAAGIQARSNAKQRTLQNILHGYTSWEQLESPQLYALASMMTEDQMENESNEAYQQRIKDKIEEIQSGNLEVSEDLLGEGGLRLPKAISEYGSYQEVVDAYAKAVMSNVLANFISSDPSLLGAWLLGEEQNDFGLFLNAIQSADIGSSTTGQYMSGLVDLLVANPDEIDKIIADFPSVYEAFKSFFKTNPDELLKEMKEETYLSNEDAMNYVAKTIAESDIVKSFGSKQYLNSDIAKMAQRVVSGNYKDWTSAQTALIKNFDEADWSALESVFPDLKKYLELTPEQRKTDEGQRIKLNYEVAIAVSGVSELEQAGEVLQGTANLIEGLKRGGEFAIKAKIEFESSLYNNQQLGAKLANGTFAQQLEAIQALTGLSTTQIMQDFPRYLEEAKAMSNGKTAESINEIAARGNIDYAREQAEKYGYTWHEGTSRDQIMDRLYREGYTYSNGNWYDHTGKISSEANDYYNRAVYGYASGQGEVGKIDYDNPFLGREKTYSDAELIKARRQMIEGTLTEGLLYSAAAQGAGNRTAEYIAKRLEVGEDNLPKYTEEQLEPYRNLALAEQVASERSLYDANFSNAFELQKALNAYANIDQAGNMAAVANYLNISEQEMKKLVDTGEIDQRLHDSLEGILDPLLAQFDDLGNIDLTSITDVESLVSALRSAAQNASDETQEAIEELIEAFEGAADAANSIDITNATTSLNEALDKMNGSRDKESATSWLINNLGEVNRTNAALAMGYTQGKDGLWYDQNGQILDNKAIESLLGMSKIDMLSAMTQNERVPIGSLINENNPLATGVIKAWDSGIMTDEQASNVFESMLYNNGRISSDSYSSIMGSLFNTGDHNFVNTNGTFDINEIMANRQEFIDLYNAISKNDQGGAELLAAAEGYEQFGDKVKALGENAKKGREGLESFNRQINDKQIDEAAQYTKNTSKLADALKLIKRGGQDAKTGLALAKKEIKSMANQVAAVQNVMGGMSGEEMKKAREKKNDKTSELLSMLTGGQFTQSDIEEMSNAELKDLFGQESIDSINENISSGLQEIWNEAVAEAQALADSDQNIDFDMSQIKATATGEPNLSALDSAISAILAAAWAKIQELSGELVSAKIDVIEGDGEVKVVGTVNGKNASTAGPKGGGGGGGGGKSELDKMLERQKHEASNVEHRIKMTQIEEEFANHMNNQGKYLYYLDNEISLQNELAGVLETNIRELQSQISTLEAGTDEWYKATQQLWEYEESLSNIKNTIFELGGKRIEIEAKMQDIADKPGSYIGSMLQMRADRYQSLGQFENYESAMKKVMSQTQADIDLNNDQIRQWENMLSLYMEGDENWIDIRDKIWEIKQQNAQLENDLLNSTLDLQQARIDQIATDLQNSMAPYEHELNMLSTLGQMYQNNEQWGSYRSALTQTNDYNSDQIKMYEDTIVELRKQMAALEEGSAAWYSARDAIYQYEEAIAQANATMQENEASMRESYITELTAKFQDAEANIQHEMNMAKTTTERFDKDNDFVNYQNMLREQLDLTEQSLELYNGKLGEMENLLSSGKVGEGGEQWRNLKEQILALREEINNAEASYEELERLIAQSQLEHIIERFNMFDELSQHNIKMIQYEETRYQAQGELTNVNTMLGYENAEQRKRAELIVAHIDQLKEQRDQLEAGSDSYKKATTEIYKWEEQLKQVNNTIEKNTETIKKNEEAILKTYKTLEDALNNEIKTRKQEERDQLSATVSLQKSILDVIRARYKSEWNLITQDLNKKKQALNEEKQLINERLNARKQAIDTQEKYEELAELRRQLALIQSDPTRTKDAKELRKQIKDLEKDLSWDIAEKEAESAIKMLDDEQKALEQWQQYQENELNDMLKDANSPQLAEELAAVLGDNDMSREERIAKYMDWLAQNDENYKYGTEAMRLQMAQNSEDAWNKMLGFVETYWDEIKAIIDGGAETIANFITEKSAQRGLSETSIELQRLNAKDMYDAYVSAIKDTAEWDHSHDIVESIKDLVDYTYKVEFVEGSIIPLDEYQSYLKWPYERDKTVTDDYVVNDMYEGTGKKEDPYIPTPTPSPTPAPTPSGGGGGSGSKKKQRGTITDELMDTYYVDDLAKGGQTTFYDKDKAMNYAQSLPGGGVVYDDKYKVIYDPDKTVNVFGGNLMANANGGLVDYTGLAWVDGTLTKPESFLDATDTELLREMLDAYNKISIAPPMIPGSDMLGTVNNTIGDVYVTINQAQLKSDADIEALAKKVGKAFNKQLAKEGFNTANYAF